MKISGQKIYDAITAIKTKYKTFNNMQIFVSYTEMRGISLNFHLITQVSAKPLPGSLDVSHCFGPDMTNFDIAEYVLQEIEIWLNNKK